MFNTTRWRRFGYTLWAPMYDLLAKPLAAARRKSIERLALRTGERVLLVGAGTGLDLDLLPPGLEITANDLTPAMLARLRERAAQRSMLVTANVMNAEAMTYANDSFDAVVLHLIVAVIPDPRRCLSEVARVLRPGGRAVVLDKFVADADRPPLLRRLLNPLASFFGTEITRKLGDILAGSGLRLVSIEPAGRSGYLTIALLEHEQATQSLQTMKVPTDPSP